MTSKSAARRGTAITAVALLSAAAVTVGVVLLRRGGSGTGFVSTAPGAVIPIGKRLEAGPLTGNLITGDGDYQLKTDLGSVVLMNYFATWCGPCQTETPQLDALYRDPKAAGVRFVGVDTKDFNRGGSRSWLADKAITFPVLWDPAGKSVIQLGHISAASLPHTVLIDKHGLIAAAYTGGVLPADLTPALATLVSEK